MKKTIIAIIVLVVVVGIFFWFRYTIIKQLELEEVRSDLKTLENEKHNLQIDNESKERELKIYQDCPSGDCKG